MSGFIIFITIIFIILVVLLLSGIALYLLFPEEFMIGWKYFYGEDNKNLKTKPKTKIKSMSKSDSDKTKDNIEAAQPTLESKTSEDTTHSVKPIKSTELKPKSSESRIPDRRVTEEFIPGAGTVCTIPDPTHGNSDPLASKPTKVNDCLYSYTQ